MVDAGIKTADDCISEYNDLKMNKSLRYIVYKVQNEEVLTIKKQYFLF